MSELTPKIIAYLAMEEGLCKEAYKDGGGVWTWALGVTNKSGHQVYPRYKDKPQDLQKCFDISVWLIKEKYWPEVIKYGLPLNEAQLAAALSFQWNSGRYWQFRDNFADSVVIRNKGLLDERRQREQDLYYNGKWPKSLKCAIRDVSHKTYSPIWNKAQLIDPIPYIETALKN